MKKAFELGRTLLEDITGHRVRQIPLKGEFVSALKDTAKTFLHLLNSFKSVLSMLLGPRQYRVVMVCILTPVGRFNRILSRF
jgi:hypothetical protein